MPGAETGSDGRADVVVLDHHDAQGGYLQTRGFPDCYHARRHRGPREPSRSVQAPATAPSDAAGMTAPDLRTETPRPAAGPGPVSPTRLLASALLHIVDRGEAPPAQWGSPAFIRAVAAHRADLAGIGSAAELDLRSPIPEAFPDAMNVLARDPLAAALAVRRLELTRGQALPSWRAIVRFGVGPRVTPAEASRWFG